MPEKNFQPTFCFYVVTAVTISNVFLINILINVCVSDDSVVLYLLCTVIFLADLLLEEKMSGCDLSICLST